MPKFLGSHLTSPLVFWKFTKKRGEVTWIKSNQYFLLKNKFCGLHSSKDYSMLKSGNTSFTSSTSCVNFQLFAPLWMKIEIWQTFFDSRVITIAVFSLRKTKSAKNLGAKNFLQKTGCKKTKKNLTIWKSIFIVKCCVILVCYLYFH